MKFDKNLLAAALGLSLSAFVLPSGVATAQDNPTGIARSATVYTGCGYTYESKINRDQQCGSGGTSKFIPAESPATPAPISRSATVYTGCGYTYQVNLIEISNAAAAEPADLSLLRDLPSQSTSQEKPPFIPVAATLTKAGLTETSNAEVVERVNSFQQKGLRHLVR